MIKNTKACLQAWRKTNCSETLRPRQKKNKKTTNLKTAAWNESKVHKRFRATNRKVGSINHKPECESGLLKSDLRSWRLELYDGDRCSISRALRLPDGFWADPQRPLGGDLGHRCCVLVWNISCWFRSLGSSLFVSQPVCAERRRGDPSHHAAVTVMR